jgi:hypothetical protein
MLFVKITILFASLLLIVQQQLSACCLDVIHYNMGITKYSTDNDSAIIVNITDITTPQNAQPFKDTLLPSHLLSRLKAAYDTSKLVVIARISDYKSYYPELLTSGTAVKLTESATVTIDTILKGSMQQQQKIMINEIDGDSRQLVYNSLKNSYDTMQLLLSITEPGYNFIKDKRFLIFAQNESQCFDLPLVDYCAIVTDAYVIDTNSQIYYDGIEIDFENRNVANVPFLKLRFNDFVDNLKPVRVLNTICGKCKYTISGNSVSTFNLL